MGDPSIGLRRKVGNQPDLMKPTHETWEGHVRFAIKDNASAHLADLLEARPVMFCPCLLVWGAETCS
jgi:hypothetical protein